MILTYRIQSGQLIESDTESASVLIYSQPTDSEKEELLKTSSLDPLDLESIYDIDEVPRIEFSPKGALIIWKCPDNMTFAGTASFEVSSIGIFFNRDKAIIISPREPLQTTGREYKGMTSVYGFVLSLLLNTLHHYQGHLKAIKHISKELQSKIETSMENKYLLQMFTLGESLIYYHNALEGNFTVLTRIKSASDTLGMASDQIMLLDDLIIESQQACKQASIYSTVLSGLMDARGSIINNNMNLRVKGLMIVNLVFLPLNLIASIGGMSEYSAFTRHIDWRISYLAFSVVMVILGWLTWWWLIRITDRSISGDKK